MVLRNFLTFKLCDVIKEQEFLNKVVQKKYMKNEKIYFTFKRNNDIVYGKNYKYLPISKLLIKNLN